MLQGSADYDVLGNRDGAPMTLTGLEISGGLVGVGVDGAAVTVEDSYIHDNAQDGIVMATANAALEVDDSTIAANGGSGVSSDGPTQIFASTVTRRRRTTRSPTWRAR